MGSPAFTMVLSSIFLKECGVQRVLATINLIAGVILLSKPLLLFSSNANNSTDSSHHYHDHDDDHDEDPGDDDGGYDVLGVVAALAVPIISACIGIIVRPVKHVHYSVLLFWVGVGGVI